MSYTNIDFDIHDGASFTSEKIQKGCLLLGLYFKYLLKINQTETMHNKYEENKRNKGSYEKIC